jgi:hypothetical protein
MRLAIARGDDSADGLYHLTRDTGVAEEYISVRGE